MVGIGKHFPGVLALENVDIALAPGKVHAQKGENGAGTSTLLKILAGVYQQDSGSIRFAGADARLRSPRDALDAGVATVYQDLALVPLNMFCLDEVKIGAIVRRDKNHTWIPGIEVYAEQTENMRR
jgi:ABC-type sugar transport system ATPase subunit